jgi:hypothetical protein
VKAEITHHAGKGSRSEILPNRSALSKLVRDPAQQRSVNDYAKATPNVVQNGPSIAGTEP